MNTKNLSMLLLLSLIPLLACDDAKSSGPNPFTPSSIVTEPAPLPVSGVDQSGNPESASLRFDYDITHHKDADGLHTWTVHVDDAGPNGGHFVIAAFWASGAGTEPTSANADRNGTFVSGPVNYGPHESGVTIIQYRFERACGRGQFDIAWDDGNNGQRVTIAATVDSAGVNCVGSPPEVNESPVTPPVPPVAPPVTPDPPQDPEPPTVPDPPVVPDPPFEPCDDDDDEEEDDDDDCDDDDD